MRTLKFLLVLLGLICVSLARIQSAEAWDGNVTIYSDGSVDPLDAPVQQNGYIYTIQEPINGSIVVLRSDVVIDGGGQTIRSLVNGICLDSVNGVIVRNMVIHSRGVGIALNHSEYCTIYNNDLVSDDTGISLDMSNFTNVESNVVQGRTGIALSSSRCNALMNNSVLSSDKGIVVSSSGQNSTDNLIAENRIKSSGLGMELDPFCFNNTIYHNNFEGNVQDVLLQGIFHNTWDSNGEGNHWSHLVCNDSDPLDGIGDYPYVIESNNTDGYPLAGEYHLFSIDCNLETYTVRIISNSSITSFSFDQKKRELRFNVTGPDYSIGFCRVVIPKYVAEQLWNGSYTVEVNGEAPLMNKTLPSKTHLLLYFAYTHSEHEVVIVPEFSSSIVLPLFMTTMLLISRKRASRRR